MSLYKLGGKYIKKSIKARQGAIFFLYLQANFLLKMKIKEIVSALERFAPLPLQDGFDNAGLQIGLTDAETTGALLCLDVTEAVLDEAIASGCNLIISHHPLIFKGYKSITGKDYVERCILKAIKNDIVIYSAHTNLDNAPGGVNFKIAEKIGLKNVRILDPKESSLIKLVTFVPSAQAEEVRNALFTAGCGCIGNYDSCSYNTEGEGTFRAQEGSHPSAEQWENFITKQKCGLKRSCLNIRKEKLSVHCFPNIHMKNRLMTYILSTIVGPKSDQELSVNWKNRNPNSNF